MALNPNLTSDASLSSVMKTYYDRMFLDRLTAKLYFHDLGTKRPLPKNEGKTVYFTRYTNFAANVTALTEGTVPNGLALSASTLSATVSQYGDYITVSDLLNLTAIDPVVKSALEVLSYRGALSIDTIIRNVLTATANHRQQFGNGKTATAALVAGDVLNAVEVRKAVRSLRADNVPPHTKGDYVAVIHPNTSYDLTADTATGGWIDITKYMSAEKIFNGEIGKIMGCRFQETTQVASAADGSASATVYRNHFLGFNAFGVVELAGGALRTFVKNAERSGTNDPLEQLNTVGYKVMFTALYLGEATANPAQGTAHRQVVVYSGASA